MARDTLEAWIPEEYASTVIQRIAQTSAIEKLGRKLPMGSDAKSFPRTAGMDVELVPKGGAYGEDTSLNDQVLLIAYKFGKVVRIAEEDIDDSIADVLLAKKTDWATSYARMLDNSCLATTAVGNGVTVAFNSVYYALTQSNSATNYTANANILKTLTTVALKYADLSNALALIEVGDYYDETTAAVIAHPAIKGQLRNVLDQYGRPITWSNGCRLSATSTSRPTGNVIMVFVTTDFLFLGVRSGPESVVIDGKDGASALTDETLMKIRSRRGFALANENAAAVLQIVP
jgi:HK97 family phage major capsid protein